MSSRQSCDVGITGYLSHDHDGFKGVIKMRFHDFVVNEIDENDQVVHLSDITCDHLKSDVDNKESENVGADIFSEEERKRINEFAKNKDMEHIMLEAGGSKDDRTKIHKAVRWLYPEFESQTVDGEKAGEKVIKVTRSKKGQRSQNYRHRMPRRSLCKFVLFKQNIGTMEAINFISKKLHINKANGFQYAGTKDKRGVTTQLVTAPVAAERLCGLNKLNSNIKVGNFSYCQNPLRLGALNGNHFSMVIRNVIGTEESIESAVRSFLAKGFVNFFGLQRFGTASIPTHKIGIAILKSEWQNVINLILEPRENDKDVNLNEGLQKFAESNDPDSALECLKYKNSLEGILLQGLKKFGKTQLLQAITMLPRNTRKMYVHAYQSFVWNKVASLRIMDYAKPIPGDLVFMQTYNAKVRGEEPPVKRMKKDPSSDDCESIKILSEDDLIHFTVEDILLPLPGHGIVYPDNMTKSWYQEIMEADGIDMQSHMVHKVKDFSLPGDYRHFVVLPKRVDYDLVRYNDYTCPLLQTDLEKLEGVNKPLGITGGKFTALRLQFSLPPSSYATVALRELMKTDLSLSAQMKFNKEHGSCGPAADAVEAVGDET